MKNLSKKGKRLKAPSKKSASKPATGIVIREPPVETKSKRKEKEKADVAHGKEIELLSKVALSEKAQMKEVRKKILRNFHKTHPSGSGTVVEKPPSVEKITPTVTSEGTGDKPGVPYVTNDESSESESESWGNDEDDNNNKQELSDESSKQVNESDSVIPESSPVFTNIPQSSHTFTPTPIQATPTPPLIIETTNPLFNLPHFYQSFDS
ncbi:hypothetical protein Tco_0148200, partial [Tanacetum coccineum]